MVEEPMDLMECFRYSLAVFLAVLGLVLAASGFGVFVAGRLDGLVTVSIGVAMFWTGWIISGARGFPCAAAAVLNMIDAASTVAFWSFEINLLVLAIGPTLFMISKIVSSLVIMLYARVHPNPRRGGIALSMFFAVIVGWNLSQHFMAYLGLKTLAYGVLLGTVFSLLASVIVLYLILQVK